MQTCAQVLLTLNNLSDRGPYLNARNTFQELLAYDTVPIVNENDTIAVEEIRFGDNDTLSSQVSGCCHHTTHVTPGMQIQDCCRAQRVHNTSVCALC